LGLTKQYVEDIGREIGKPYRDGMTTNSSKMLVITALKEVSSIANIKGRTPEEEEETDSQLRDR
jgi:hypothetical protein